jgi:hypothetical protein
MYTQINGPVRPAPRSALVTHADGFDHYPQATQEQLHSVLDAEAWIHGDGE